MIENVAKMKIMWGKLWSAQDYIIADRPALGHVIAPMLCDHSWAVLPKAWRCHKSFQPMAEQLEWAARPLVENFSDGIMSQSAAELECFIRRPVWYFRSFFFES